MFKRHFERLQKEHHSGDRLGGELELTFSNPTSRGHVNVSFLSLQPAFAFSCVFIFSENEKLEQNQYQFPLSFPKWD